MTLGVVAELLRVAGAAAALTSTAEPDWPSPRDQVGRDQQGGAPRPVTT
jgi:hypothetical protein